MKRQRRLRRLVPDAELIRRRAAGETLRELAPDYDVEHTTLGRFFERPEVAKELKEAVRQLRLAERVKAERLAEKRRLEREVRKKAKEQARREREDARRIEAELTVRASRRRRPRDRFGARLDERAARRPPPRADWDSRSDEIAAEVVAAGGGMQAVIDATNLRTLENVTRLIDPTILKRALDNDVLEQAHPPSVV